MDLTQQSVMVYHFKEAVYCDYCDEDAEYQVEVYNNEYNYSYSDWHYVCEKHLIKFKGE